MGRPRRQLALWLPRSPRNRGSGEPDVGLPLTPLHVDGLVRPSYRAFPLPDHVADTFAAILGTHIRGRRPGGKYWWSSLVTRLGLLYRPLHLTSTCCP